MTAAGVAKLIEECGELTQVLAKKLAYWHTDEHPDGAGSLNRRIEEEMGDVVAAIAFVVKYLPGLSAEAVDARAQAKFQLFEKWESDPDNNDLAIDRKTP